MQEKTCFASLPNQSVPSIIFLLFIEQSHSSVAKSVSVEYFKGRVTTVTVKLVKGPNNSSQSWDDMLETWSVLMVCDFSWDGSHKLI